MDTLNYRARAKINLGLDICGRLPNGYHEIRTVMQAVDIYDELGFRRLAAPDIILSVSSRDDLGDLENNLIFRAAKLMKERFGIREGVEIHLKKSIPVAAGMAGGSTDAAVTMCAMNEMFGLGLDRQRLMEEAVPLGADIPFCILGGTALAEGIGEKLTPLSAPPRAAVLIVKPPIMVSTKWVYEQFRAGRQKTHPDIDGMVEALRQGDLKGVTDRMENVMETVTEHKYPIIADIKKMMMENGAMNAAMSGSGPSIFGIFTETAAASGAAASIRQALRERNVRAAVKVTRFYNENAVEAIG